MAEAVLAILLERFESTLESERKVLTKLPYVGNRFGNRTK
jgi:endonuclease III